VPRAGDHSLRVLARTPAVIVHVPEGLGAGQRAALVLGLHGAGQDARYLRAALDAVARTQCVDRGRVLVTGISSGEEIWRFFAALPSR
jgi:poly(3-hydroxybutyrate) depolymerase